MDDYEKRGEGGHLYVRKVMDAMTAMLPHFFQADQLRLFVGSSGPSKSTISTSEGTCVCVSCASFLLGVKLLICASRSASFSSSEVLGDPLSVFSSRIETRLVGKIEDGDIGACLTVEAFEMCNAADSYSEGGRGSC